MSKFASKKVTVKKGQLWKHKISGLVVVVTQKHGEKWIIVPNDKQLVTSHTSHTVMPATLWRSFDLI